MLRADYYTTIMVKFCETQCSFGIGYGIGRKYLPIWVSVLNLNQNSGFGRTLCQTQWAPIKESRERSLGQ